MLHALDASSGQPVWEARPDAHPLARVIGTPKLYDGRLYVPVSSMEEVAAADPRYACCTFRGSIAVLDAASGRKLWQHYAIETAPQPIHPGPAGAQRFAPAGGAIFSSPTLDLKRGALYVGTGDAYTEGSLRGTDSVLALDLASGKRRWQRQALAADAWILGCKPTPHANCPQPLGPDFDFAASPVLATMSNGRDVLIAAAKSGRVYGLDPDDRGRILWSTELAPGSSHGGILWGPATEAQRTFVAVAGYDMATGTGPGALVALDNATGKVLWRTPAAALPCAWGAANCSQAQIGAVSAIPGVVFAGAMDGRLRAYRSSDGAVIWEFDTGGEFAAVNGAKAHGGAIDYGAQTIAYGMLFVQSGSMRQPGNLLLAFSVDGR